MIVRCMVACHFPSGMPTFFPIKVYCQSIMEIYDKKHYAAACFWATEEDYEGPFVVFDDGDGVGFLFDDEEFWSNIDVVPAGEYEAKTLAEV